MPHGDARGFIHHLEKDEKVYIVAAKIHVRGLRLERVWRFTDWRLSGRLIGAFRFSDNIPDVVKKAAAREYLLDWLGWFGGKESTRNVLDRSKIRVEVNTP